MSLADLSAILSAPPAPAAAQQTDPTPAPVPELLATKLPLPVQVRDLLLAPPEGIDAGAQLDAFGISYEIPLDLLAQIVESQPAGYTAETLAQIAAQLPEPAGEVQPALLAQIAANKEVQPEPTKLEDGPRTPPKKRRGRPKKVEEPTPDALTRAERLAIACAAIEHGTMSVAEARAYILDLGAGE